ncbi:MAG TPA: hypothetical protein VJ743_00175, partial [Albitalea sp.]|nr:hypothetical protein [Albitalea sp.]
MNKSTLSRAAACLAAWACLPAAALACSSCGCTLNGDWAGQGLVSGTGWSVDLRHDFFVQDDLRRGTGRVDRGAIGVPADFE